MGNLPRWLKSDNILLRLAALWLICVLLYHRLDSELLSPAGGSSARQIAGGTHTYRNAPGDDDLPAHLCCELLHCLWSHCP